MRADRIAGALVIAAGLVLSAALALLNFNPFMLAFQTTITITNKSGKDLTVSPVGLAEGSGRLYPLPIFVSAAPALPAIRQGRFKVNDGETLSLNYDWDDILFTSVVIEADGLPPRELIIEPSAKAEDCCYVPKTVNPTITDLDQLGKARPEALRAASEHSWNVRGLVLWLPLLGPILFGAGLIMLLTGIGQRKRIVTGDA